MIIVIDSNILFSALISNTSIIRKIIFLTDTQFVSSEVIIQEFEKYKSELIEKTKLKEEDFEELYHILMKRICLIKNETLKEYIPEAKTLCENIDLKDTEFIACALAYSNSILWTEDKALKRIPNIKVCNTKEILEILT
jgi:predicted nucleic acid-binding protein